MQPVIRIHNPIRAIDQGSQDYKKFSEVVFEVQVTVPVPVRITFSQVEKRANENLQD
jgi:hypothetical protein